MGAHKQICGHPGKNITYTYDNAGRMLTAKEGNTVTATYEYDKNGNRTKLTLANGNVSTYEYNKQNLVTSVENRKTASGGSTVGGSAACTTAYTYDKKNQLLTEQKVSNTETVTTEYFYDPNGNTVSRTTGTINTDFGTSGVTLAVAIVRTLFHNAYLLVVYRKT